MSAFASHGTRDFVQFTRRLGIHRFAFRDDSSIVSGKPEKNTAIHLHDRCMQADESETIHIGDGAQFSRTRRAFRNENISQRRTKCQRLNFNFDDAKLKQWLTLIPPHTHTFDPTRNGRKSNELKAEKVSAPHRGNVCRVHGNREKCRQRAPTGNQSKNESQFYAGRSFIGRARTHTQRERH